MLFKVLRIRFRNGFLFIPMQQSSTINHTHQSQLHPTTWSDDLNILYLRMLSHKYMYKLFGLMIFEKKKNSFIFFNNSLIQEKIWPTRNYLKIMNWKFANLYYLKMLQHKVGRFWSFDFNKIFKVVLNIFVCKNTNWGSDEQIWIFSTWCCFHTSYS